MFLSYRAAYTTLRPAIANTTAKTKPTTNRIQAMFVAMPAMPEKPRTAAMIATTKNVAAQPIIEILLLYR
jgi:hypothetical protein